MHLSKGPLLKLQSLTQKKSNFASEKAKLSCLAGWLSFALPQAKLLFFYVKDCNHGNSSPDWDCSFFSVPGSPLDRSLGETWTLLFLSKTSQSPISPSESFKSDDNNLSLTTFLSDFLSLLRFLLSFEDESSSDPDWFLRGGLRDCLAGGGSESTSELYK